MEVTFPGTVVPRKGKSAGEFLSGLFFATKGIMLVQVREITGLDTPALQNWVGRGWVRKPVRKRYSENHLARILMINMLRPVAKLEHIVRILSFINGDAQDDQDDIIPDAKLYIYVCDILDRVDFETVLTEDALEQMIVEEIGDYREPFLGARKKLISGIKLILIYYAAAIVKVWADRMLQNLGLADVDTNVNTDTNIRELTL